MCVIRSARWVVLVTFCLLPIGAYAADPAAVSQAVADAAAIAGDEGQPLLPAGTTVDSAEWDGNILHVDLTVPADVSPWEVTPIQMEDASEALALPFKADAGFGGIVVRVRVGPDGFYRLLGEYVPSAPAEPPSPEPADVVDASGFVAGARAADGLRSPAVGHQPVGALTGVTVFAAAGHGWTVGTTTWGLQRPLLLDMIEDYGNIDQLNYFATHLYNAGATVVPFRPVGYQNTEIVLDQDDPEVTYTGSWTDSTGTPYYESGTTVSGVGYRFASSATSETATARYTPNIPSADYYPVYTWALSSNNRVLQKYRIVHSGGTTEVEVDHRLVGKGWVWLGHWHFAAGTGGYVEISNQSAVSGAVIADAIRIGNGIGDVIGVGPGTVSGYPRDEEAQRYWAESETHNNAVGMSTGIYDISGSSDSSDNVGTAARWGREMNETVFNNDRWRRVYLEFHTNASSGSAKGTVALITTSGATTNQAVFADIMGGEIETDMTLLQSGFEYTWGVRANTYTASYGAINTPNNGNEFDATILEVAFHDNIEDAALMLDPKVRDAVAHSSVQGIIKFLHGLAGSTVPLAFPPASPRQVQATHNGAGGVVVSWLAPLSGEAYGDAAAGYLVYRSSNGYGFDGGLDVGNVLTTTLNDIPADTTTYIRVAAYNAGGESLPSEVLAVRRGADETATFLIVNGFDRIDRSQDPSQTIPAGTQRRPILHHVNTSDYAVRHGAALAAAGATFDSCSNEAIIAGTVSLLNYPAVAWILGEESTANETFGATEQTRVTSYLNAGGNLLATGAEIGWDLDAGGSPSDQTFYNNYLKADYSADDANTYNVTAAGGSIFNGIAAFSFDNGAVLYNVDTPDALATFGGSAAALSYSGGTGGTAGVVYDGTTYQVVNFGFPFETITSASTRSQVMDRVVGFFFHDPFDADRDGDVDLKDYVVFESCMQGPDADYAPGNACLVDDGDADLDVDLFDFADFQAAFTG